MAKHLNPNHPSLSALDTIEEATGVLRRIPLYIISLYYIGTLPFALAFLYFFTDMSKNPFAHEYILEASFGMALLFIWMKTFQAVFCTKAYEHISGIRLHPFTLSRTAGTVLRQTVIQTTSLIVLPAALIITIPYAWVFAMYQMALIETSSNTRSFSEKIKSSYAAARANTFSNHMIILILTVFSLFVFLNTAATLYAGPFILKAFLGKDTIFTLGGFNIFNTTFLMTAACLTYLLTDPLCKIVYVIQKYDFTSRETGDDLLSALDTIKSKNFKLGLAALILFFACFPATPGYAAQETNTAAAGEIILSPEQLDAAVKNIISRPEYAWRLPQPETPKAPGGFFADLFKWTAAAIKDTVETMAGWFKSLAEWIKKIFEKEPADPPDPGPDVRTVKPGHLAAVLMLFCAILLGSVFYHLKKSKPHDSKETDEAEPPPPDIENENILADHLPADQWRDLAEKLVGKGDFRLAVRAVYLACLAELADRNYIRIAVHKSNRDYFVECSKKAASGTQMSRSFKQLVQTVDRVWYGMHPADRRVYDDFLSTQEKVIRFASA